MTTQLCGIIDPHSLDDYLAFGGYAALRQALTMTPDAIIQAVKDARLRGRGGAGFPTGTKWEIGHRQPGRTGEVPHLQRRRGRPRRVHGPHRDGRRPAPRARKA